MKREDAMKGSWSSTVDERCPSLAVDDGGRGSGSGKVEDGVADGGGWPQWGGCRGTDGV